MTRDESYYIYYIYIIIIMIMIIIILLLLLLYIYTYICLFIYTVYRYTYLTGPINQVTTGPMGGNWMISSSKQVAIGHGIPVKWFGRSSIAAQRLWHNVVFQLPCGLKLMGQQYPTKALDV